MESFNKKLICHQFQLGTCELSYACNYSHSILPKIKGQCDYGRVCSEKHTERDCLNFLKNFECPKGINCDYIHNWSLKYDEENREEFRKNLFEMNRDLETLADYQKQLMNHTALDMLFIVDCTVSMTPWIKACKDDLNAIINHLQTDFPHTKIRAAFIG